MGRRKSDSSCRRAASMVYIHQGYQGTTQEIREVKGSLHCSSGLQWVPSGNE